MIIYEIKEVTNFYESKSSSPKKPTTPIIRSIDDLDTLTDHIRGILSDTTPHFMGSTYPEYLFKNALILGNYSEDATKALVQFLNYLLSRMINDNLSKPKRCLISLAWQTVVSLIFTEPAFSLLREMDDKGEINPPEHGIPRDHSLHVGLVYYLGYDLLKKNKNIRENLLNLFEKSHIKSFARSVYGKFKFDENMLYDFWELASLSHDCSYTMKLESKLYAIRKGSWIQNVSTPLYATSENLIKLYRKVWNNLQTAWRLTDRVGIKKTRERLLKEIPNDNSEPDHGHLASILILEYLSKETSAADDPIERALVLLVASTIFRHNAWASKIDKQESWEQDPLSCFLTLVDELSEWSRVFWQTKTSRRLPNESDWSRLNLYAVTLFKQLQIIKKGPNWQWHYNFVHPKKGSVFIEKAIDDSKKARLNEALNILNIGKINEIYLSGL